MEMYQNNYIRSVKEHYEKVDHIAWRNGVYMIPAIQVALNPKKAKYPEQPYGMKEEEAVQQHPEIQARKFEDWANEYNKKFEQKHNDGA